MTTDSLDPVAIEDKEFTRGPVAQSATIAAFRIAIILLAANISIPIFVIGGELGLGVGVKSAVAACVWGGLTLGFLAGLSAYAGARSRLTTYVLIINAFGRRGGQLVNLLLSLSATGWFAVVLMLFARTMVGMVARADLLGGATFWVVAGSIVMVWTCIVGFKAVDRLSIVMLPLKLGLVAWFLWAAIRKYGTDFTAGPGVLHTLDGTSAISLVVGGWVVGAVIAPDFARFARRPVSGALAVALALGVGYPLVLIAMSLPAVLTGQKDTVVTMLSLGMGLSALAMVLFASWLNGATNLYFGSLMLATVFTRRPRWLLTVAIGFIGMTLGLLGIADRVVPYLIVLSIVTPPVAGVYLPRFYIELWTDATRPVPRDWQPAALAAWASGVGFATLSSLAGLALTGVTALDSFLVSAAVYLAFELMRYLRIEHPPA